MAAHLSHHDASPPRTIGREPSSPTTLARRERTLSTLTDRLKRKEKGIHIIYQGADKELFWSTVDDLRRAPFPFLDEITDPEIRRCIEYLKGKKYAIIPPERLFNPDSILAGSSKNTTIKKKRGKGDAVRTRRSGRTRRAGRSRRSGRTRRS